MSKQAEQSSNDSKTSVDACQCPSLSYSVLEIFLSSPLGKDNELSGGIRYFLGIEVKLELPMYRPHYGPGVDSASNSNEYQMCLLEH